MSTLIPLHNGVEFFLQNSGMRPVLRKFLFFRRTISLKSDFDEANFQDIADKMKTNLGSAGLPTDIKTMINEHIKGIF